MKKIVNSISGWRVYSAISFLNQALRVPLLLSFAVTSSDLQLYFLISGTSIPVQFIANDILQYQSTNHSSNYREKGGLLALAIGSIIYVGWVYGIQTGITYFIFAISLLFYGSSVGYLRDVSTPIHVLRSDAVYNSAFTIISGSAALLIVDNAFLGLFVVATQTFLGFLFGIHNRIQGHNFKQQIANLPTLNNRQIHKVDISPPVILIGIMISTQLERLIISVAGLSIMACITLAAGIVQAWRRIGMDDAIVYDKLRASKGNLNTLALMVSELKRARLVFYPTLILSIAAFFFIDHVIKLFSYYGFLRSLNTDSYEYTAYILCVYLAAMPAAIVVVNILRCRVFDVKFIGWFVLLLTIAIELITLICKNYIVDNSQVALSMIALTSSIYFFLFLSLCSESQARALKILSFDFAVYIFTLIICSLLLFSR